MEGEEKVNILLVDDNEKNLLSLAAVLEGPGQDLVTARSGEEALKCLLNQEFAVILLDVQMPGLDGFETAELIRSREKSRHTPIIFVTAIHKTERHVLKGYCLGAVDYVFKPIVAEVLKAKVGVFAELFRRRAEVQQKAAALQEVNEELRSSRGLLAAVLDSSVDAILTVDEGGRIRSLNQRTVDLFGYGEAELLGKKLDVLWAAGSGACNVSIETTSTYGGGR